MLSLGPNSDEKQICSFFWCLAALKKRAEGGKGEVALKLPLYSPWRGGSIALAIYSKKTACGLQFHPFYSSIIIGLSSEYTSMRNRLDRVGRI
jgi:hypothetical protein